MSHVSIDDFWNRFDQIDEDELRKLLKGDIQSLEQIDIADILKVRPSAEKLFDRADHVIKDVRDALPECMTLWREYRQPSLDIRQLREEFYVTMKDGSKKLVTNPYASLVHFSCMPADRIPPQLNLESASVAIANDVAIVVNRSLRVLDNEFTVDNAVLHYELFPYLVQRFGLEKAERVREPVIQALALMFGNRHEKYPFEVQEYFGSSAREAQRLYKQSKNPRELLRMVQDAA